jgi:predicted  nucleic acid-binding Zn-ribbon protein
VIQQQGQLAEQDVMKLLAELRKWKQLEADKEIEAGKLEVARQTAENEKKALELKIAEYNRNVEEATDEARNKIESGRAITREDIDRIRERVFGLPARAAQPAGSEAATGGSTLPVPTKVG